MYAKSTLPITVITTRQGKEIETWISSDNVGKEFFFFFFLERDISVYMKLIKADLWIFELVFYLARKRDMFEKNSLSQEDAKENKLSFVNEVKRRLNDYLWCTGWFRSFYICILLKGQLIVTEIWILFFYQVRGDFLLCYDRSWRDAIARKTRQREA